MTKPKSAPNVRIVDRVINGIVTSAWLWGTAVTFAFYAGLPFFPIYQESISRYFTAHWIEYATTGLFFIGIATLVMKATRIPAERGALAADLLDGLKLDTSLDAVETARGINEHLDLVARRCEESILVRRIRDVIDYVVGRRSADGLEGHLNYLSDLASGRLHDGYALIRTITWAVPILGFLGTVIGITMAIANITPDQLESSLPEVTAGLAVAFDTTALSLALSMILVFGTFVIERAEQQTLDEIEDVGVKQLICLFPAAGTPTGPLVNAEAEAASQLLTRTEGMINWQMDLWQTSLESLRDRWTSTLARQQEVLDQAFQSGLTTALSDHAEQLSAARTEFVTAFETSSATIARQVAESQAALVEQQERSAALISQTWQSFHADLSEARDGQTVAMTQLTESLTGAAMGWSDRLENATLAMTDQLRELREQGSMLLKITEGESELVRLEERLAQNLDSVRVADSLEETLLNLNAAVNLMTSRVKGKAA
ncbi:MAG: MotA/TolQ/ExbB proton channel family protein [Planctomycetota bacterium]